MNKYTLEELETQIRIYQQLLYMEKRRGIRKQEFFMIVLHLGSLAMMWLASTSCPGFSWIVYIMVSFHICLAIGNIIGSYSICTKLNLADLEYIKVSHECCWIKYDGIVLYSVIVNAIGTLALMQIDKSHAWIYCIILAINSIASLCASSKLKSIKLEE